MNYSDQRYGMWSEERYDDDMQGIGLVPMNIGSRVKVCSQCESKGQVGTVIKINRNRITIILDTSSDNECTRLYNPSSLYVLHPTHDEHYPKYEKGKTINKIDLYGMDEFDRGHCIPNIIIPVRPITPPRQNPDDIQSWYKDNGLSMCQYISVMHGIDFTTTHAMIKRFKKLEIEHLSDVKMEDVDDDDDNSLFGSIDKGE
jgi:hypothetical protein